MRLLSIMLVLIAASVLGACGQKGLLYMPDNGQTGQTENKG